MSDGLSFIDKHLVRCKFSIMSQIQHIISLSVAPSDDLYRMVRAGFVAKGTTLNAWCIANGVNRQTARRALSGERNGKNSRQLRERLVDAALKSANEAA